jgi:hypothetical protein
MSIQSTPLPRLSNHSQPEADPTSERVDRLAMPEQVTGGVPQRTERPFADILAERLAEADPASLSFVP